MDKPINSRLLRKFKSKAEQAYLRGNYDESVRFYSQILVDLGEDLESRVGLLLADMARDYEEESKAFYEYYQLLKRHKHEDAHKIILEMIENFDGNVSEIVSVARFSDGANAESVPGILYSDFKRLVQERGDFKNTFEDLLFSSKIIITAKGDFFDMLEQLLEHGFKEMAMSYLETMSRELAHEPRLQKLYKRAMGT